MRMRTVITSLIIGSMLSPASFARGQNNPTQSLDARVRAEITPFKGRVFLFAKNLDTGETYSFDGDERVRTASTIKVAVMIEAFTRVAEGGRNGRTNWC